jgi:alpha-1,3-mannosyltransferase
MPFDIEVAGESTSSRGATLSLAIIPNIASWCSFHRSASRRRIIWLTVLATIVVGLWSSRHLVSQIHTSLGLQSLRIFQGGSTSPPSGLTDLPNTDSLFMEEAVPASEVVASQINDSTVHFVQAIMDPATSPFEKLKCAKVGRRYESLKVVDKTQRGILYIFALDLTQASSILPQLLGAIVEAARYLGPRYCALSIVEGQSVDETCSILEAVRQPIERLGMKVHLRQSEINSRGEEDRIVALAALRNLALSPVINDPSSYDPTAKIIFSNDVVLCPDDFLELLYQLEYQKATMACAFDWQWQGTCFYDSWVARSMSGSLFFDIPQPGWTAENSQNLFWDDPISRDKFQKVQPMQVYSCWNGVVSVKARPFIEHQLQFRSAEEDECYNGEPVQLSKDLWRLGMGRIMAVPSVNVAYDIRDGVETKARRGFVSDHINSSDPEPQSDMIIWQEPPPKIACIGKGWSGLDWVSPLK